MSRSHIATALLASLMFLVGGAALFACVFLPPWLESRALRQERAAAVRRIAELEEQLARANKQIEHLRNDPSYHERIVLEEFGIKPPGVEIIGIEALDTPATRASSSDAAPAARPDGWATGLEHATQHNAFVAVFVLDPTRPIVMVMSGVLIAAALTLLLRVRSVR